MDKIAIIGGGFAGLSAASCLAQKGYSVHLFEKHQQMGGRARQFHQKGFTFDMGPSWYWMPEIFEQFFQQFDKRVADYYQLQRLQPPFRFFFSKQEGIDFPDRLADQKVLFEHMEKGAGNQLDDFLKEARQKYETSMENWIYQPNLSWLEYLSMDFFKSIRPLQTIRTYRSHINRYFTDSRLKQLLQFPILFLGALPQQAPALYSLMNYAQLSLGTWYPQGGMHSVVQGMQSLAEEQGVHIHPNCSVNKINIKHQRVDSIEVNSETFDCDAVVGTADYHHIEQQLLPTAYRTYTRQYWENSTLSPSALIYYVGVDKKLSHLDHHNLFFDASFDQHAQKIYKHPDWPSDPLFYVCCPSKTDSSTAPRNKENLFILMPVSPGLNDTPEIHQHYFEQLISRLETRTHNTIANHIETYKSYGVQDFAREYNAFKGHAYGLANTYQQTAFLRPKIQSAKVPNLFYAGQMTVPGPGVPPSILSGQIVAETLDKSNS